MNYIPIILKPFLSKFVCEFIPDFHVVNSDFLQLELVDFKLLFAQVFLGGCENVP